MRRLLSFGVRFGIKLEVLLTFAIGCVVGMLFEAELIVAAMSGHSLLVKL